MSTDTIDPDAPGYIVAWKFKYEFSAGKNLDDTMTYKQACERAEELSAKHPEKTFWAERLSEELRNRFYKP